MFPSALFIFPPNVRVQRRGVRRDPCFARGVTRECVRWNEMLDDELTVERSLQEVTAFRCDEHCHRYCSDMEDAQHCPNAIRPTSGPCDSEHCPVDRELQNGESNVRNF